jgi:hypothetical protein
VYNIEIDRSKHLLILLENGVRIKSYPVAVGKPETPTPAGDWVIVKKGLWGKQFGGHFLQLDVPQGVYGIHGTNKPGRSAGRFRTVASACTTVTPRSCISWFLSARKYIFSERKKRLSRKKHVFPPNAEQ